MASMGTDVEDPVRRLEAVIDSTSQAKKQMAGMGQLPALAYSGYLLAPSLAQTLAAIAGVKNPLPTTFNLVLSNVPGPKKTLYLRGSRLEAVYPVSIPAHGMALNITLETYAGTMNFGFIGDREAVPHLQRLAVYTGEALTALERGLGLLHRYRGHRACGAGARGGGEARSGSVSNDPRRAGQVRQEEHGEEGHREEGHREEGTPADTA